MGWIIRCTDPGCGLETVAANIVDLLGEHVDPGTNLFMCRCGRPGYIRKSFELQEPGQTWAPILRGAVKLGTPGRSYQPFVFLVSYDDCCASITDVWFSYYKDMRAVGGRLKLGYGPGGPPVLGTAGVLALVKRLGQIGVLSGSQLAELAL